jgi:hypothetical protein
MITLTIRSTVDPDGTLRLEVPSGLPPGPVEVVVIVQPATTATEPEPNPDRPANGQDRPRRPARSGLFLNRGLSRVDVDAITAEIDAAWQAKLADLEP